jgi:hypothetical protein
MIILNYILPPWLTTKKIFLMLALLIPGKNSMNNSNIDIYMVPLLEFQELWIRVNVVDVTRLP